METSLSVRSLHAKFSSGAEPTTFFSHQMSVSLSLSPPLCLCLSACFISIAILCLSEDIALSLIEEVLFAVRLVEGTCMDPEWLHLPANSLHK